MPNRPQTPLRRVSQGSLRRLSRSGAFQDTPHGLGFLGPAMAELADETEALQVNVEGLHNLSRSLESFNESFASYLYVMQMNALTVDWPQAPTDASYDLARRRAQEDARTTLAALEAARAEARAAEIQAAETTLNAAANETTFTETASTHTIEAAGKPGGVRKTGGVTTKKKGKPKLTAKERKERSFAIDQTVSSLPLEFRGSDVTLRKNLESIIEHLMDSNKEGIRLHDMIKPDINQARVNKCLIALVNRKIVTKDNSSGQVLYTWGGVPT